MSSRSREATHMDLGRGRLDWTQDTWKKIDGAVHDEFLRTATAAKFIPLFGPVADAVTVPSDVIDQETMTVDEVATTSLIELSVEFGLSRQQVAAEGAISTAVSLATRSANLLSQGEDVAIFRGDEGLKDDLFRRVRYRGGAAGPGLVNAAGQTVPVAPVAKQRKRYGAQTFEAVAAAYSLLQSRGHYGPYALAL